MGAEVAREQISTDDWYALYRTLTQQLPREQLRLHLDLTLRHASGQLFQEAHYEAYRSPQMPLNLGLSPAPMTVKFENKAAGLHFTPPALVRVIVEEALRILERTITHLKVFDPACGSAEFLRETLRQLLLQGFKGKIQLIGWDISPAACDMARFILHREIADWGAFDRVEFTIEEGDSLAEDRTWPSNVDVVAMNPPFVRWKDMTPDHKAATERLLVPQLGSSAARQIGNYDLSHVFFVQAGHCLTERGILATILPVSVLDSKAAEKVRGHLSELMQAHMIARLGSHSLFSNALVDAAFYIGQNRRAASHNTGSPLAFWSDHRSSSSSLGFRALRRSHTRNFHSQISEETQEDKTGFCFYYQPQLGSETEQWLPRPSKAWKLWQRLRSHENLSLVDDLFYVEQGIRTGCNEAFVLTEAQWEALPLKEQEFFRPCIRNASINDGQVTSWDYVFYPYAKKAIQSEEHLQKTLPVYFAAFLQHNKQKLKDRYGAIDEMWWLLSVERPQQEKIATKLISTYFGSAGSFAWDVDSKFMVVQGQIWSPKRSKALSNSIGLSYLAVLNSPLFIRLVSAVSHHVSGGQWDLSKRYVRQLPIPNLFDAAASPALIEELTEVGRTIHKQGLPPEGLSQESLATVARAYGLGLEDL